MRRPTVKITRDTLLFAMGSAGIIYETVASGTEKPTLLLVFAGMVGLPLFIRNDEARRNERDTPPPTPAPPPDEVHR